MFFSFQCDDFINKNDHNHYQIEVLQNDLINHYYIESINDISTIKCEKRTVNY